MPNKVKHFAWRACNNALPTMANLAHRNISPFDVCELCKTAPKDTFHALWACSKLEEVWNMLSWTQSATHTHPLSFNNLLDCFLQVQEDFRKEFFIMVAWTIWNRQNALKFGHPTVSVDYIIPKVGALLQEFLAAQDRPTEVPPPPQLLFFTSGILQSSRITKPILMRRFSDKAP